MADAFSSYIVEWHGGKTRAYVNAWVSSQTDKTATITIQGCCQAWRITQYGVRVRLYINGQQVRTTTANIFSRNGTSDVGSISGTLTIQKGSSGKNVSCQCTIAGEVVNGYGAISGSRTASVNVWVGAKTLRPPSAPTDLVAQRTSAGVLGINWTNNAANATNTYVERKEYTAGTWQEVYAQAQVITTYSDTVGQGTYKYRVRYSNADGYSGYSNETEWVTALAAPAAPSIVSPLSGSTLDSSDGNPTVVWQHNSTDTSAQTGAQLKWTTDPDWSTGVTTLTFTTETSAVLQALVEGDDDVNKDIYWQVRTKGAYDGDGTDENAWSPWSQVSMFSMRTAPQIVLTTDATLTEVPIEMSWTYEDAFGTQTSAKIVLSDDTGEVFAKIVEGNSTTAEIAAAEFTPTQGVTYTLSVTVTSTTSLHGTDTAEFTVEYEPPAKPVFSISTDEERHSNTITVYETLYEIGTEHINLFRDGVLVAEGLSSGDSYEDILPPLDKEMTYRAVAYAASGATSELSQVSTVKSNGFLCVNYGENWDGFAKMRRNLSNPDAVQGEKVVRSVASSRLPKVFYGTHATRSASATADVWQFDDIMGDGDYASIAAFRVLEAYNGNVWLRFPFGDSFLATVDTSHDSSTSSKNWANVSIDWQEVAQ